MEKEQIETQDANLDIESVILKDVRNIVCDKNTCKVYYYHVKINNLHKKSELMMKQFLDESWLLKIDDEGDRVGFKVRSELTIKMLKRILNNVNSEIGKEFGEYLVSSTSLTTLQNEQGHEPLPLAEIWKEQESKNPGFDFHTISKDNLIEEFINKGYAKICFATSTLLQGINMPFDVVWIDNYRFNGINESEKVLELKNLIGRAGRTNPNKSSFDFGYVIVPQKNIENLFKRLATDIEITNTSQLDTDDLSKIDEDMHDLVEAIRNDAFDDELQITNEQKERLKKPDVEENIKFLLNNMFFDEDLMSATAYGNLTIEEKQKITEAFKNIFIKHLRRNQLNEAEQSVLSVAIRILLWKIEGRSFQQIVQFRYRYITKAKEREKIEKKFKNGEISHKLYRKFMKSIELHYSQTAHTLPKYNLVKNDLFGQYVNGKYSKGKLVDL